MLKSATSRRQFNTNSNTGRQAYLQNTISGRQAYLQNTISGRQAYHRAYYRKHRDRLLRLANQNHTQRRLVRTQRRFPFLAYLKEQRERCGIEPVVLYFD